MSIEVKNLSKFYGEQAAVNDISFSIGKGEIVGFLGPNGAGKSTTMKMITGFIPASEGEIRVCGKEVSVDSIETRKHVGYLPENNPLYLDMYVKEYLEFVGNIYKIKNVRERVKEMIRLVGLEVEQNKKIGMLSKGYRQRVGLAQAIIHNPDVLILDEPTSGLDPNQLVEIRDLIKALCFITGRDYEEVARPKKPEGDGLFWPGEWYEWGFFRFRPYKKGTVHFEFLDEEVWAAVNARYAKIKGQVLPETHRRPKARKGRAAA